MLFPTILCLLVASVHMSGEGGDDCSEPILFYEALKCKPVYGSPGDRCPFKYDCTHIEQRAAATEEKCYFNGRAYGEKELVNNDDDDHCIAGCFCNKRSSKRMLFQCAITECPEALVGVLKPGCHHRYELNQCCSVGTACSPFSTTCEVDGVTYHEGQRFTAPNVKCTKCICGKGFDGKFGAPFCKKEACIDEIWHQNEVHAFCAPIYLNLSDCCPYNWICPQDGDNIVATEMVKNPDLKCRFGERTLNIGDKLNRADTVNNWQFSCECRVPPYLTCIQSFE